MLSRDELAAWLRLSETPAVGLALGRRLLAAFGSPERVIDAGESALREVVGPAAARALVRPDARRDALPEATWRWLEAAPADAPRSVIALGDPAYPPLLLETADPPLLLYTIGRAELLQAPAIAIVGSRNATPQGIENARVFAQHLSERKLTIVSGLAQGIDAAAHEGGLAGPGRTVAFVGTGLDRVYPRRHVDLAQRIGRDGLVASEYPLGMEPVPGNFPRRNRLIAGITRGTLVVEAALQSGSLITARLALEGGREVFAIPGSIHSPQARGCHRLIQQGAKLVETGDDIVSELLLDDRETAATGSPAPPRAGRPASSQASLFAPRAPASADGAPRTPAIVATVVTGRGDDDLLSALGHDPVTFDALAARTGEPTEVLAARLLDLELRGLVVRLPGGLLQRRGLA